MPPAPRVVLGVCGSIAAYKAVEVCRRLVDGGAHVIPVMTADAGRFLGEVTLSSLASEPVRDSSVDRSRRPRAPHRPGPHRRRRPRGPGHRPPAGHLRRRHRRRPADRHPAGHPGPGRRLPGHAHRDVGAPRHPGQRGPAAGAGRARRRPRHRQARRRRRRCRPPPRPGSHRGRGLGRARAVRRTSPAAASSSPPAAPASRSTRSASWGTARRAGRARPSRWRPPGGAPTWCSSPPPSTDLPLPGSTSSTWRRRPRWRPR